MVLYYHVPSAIKKFEEALMPVYVIWSNRKVMNFEQGVEDDKRLIRSLADLLGGNAHKQAEKWCRYYDEKVSFIKARTENIPEIELPSGLFYLDKGSSKPLYYLWLAKQINPEKFEDIDIIKEMQFYFKEFYRYNLSKEDAEHGLKGWKHNPNTKY